MESDLRDRLTAEARSRTFRSWADYALDIQQWLESVAKGEYA